MARTGDRRPNHFTIAQWTIVMGAGITNSKKDTTYVQQYNRLTINLKK
jgi:hypothetical protein